MRKLYDTLGVSEDAAPDQIKKAYRELSKKHHPDKGGDENTFKQIAEAYEILSDPEKRKRYDQTGQTKPEKSFEDLFRGFVAQVILPEIETARSTNANFMGRMSVVISEIRATGDNKLSEAEKSRDNIKDALTRLKRKDEGEDLMAQVLQSKIAAWDRSVEQIKGELEFLKRCEDELSMYDYEYTASGLDQASLDNAFKGTEQFLRFHMGK